MGFHKYLLCGNVTDKSRVLGRAAAHWHSMNEDVCSHRVFLGSPERICNARCMLTVSYVTGESRGGGGLQLTKHGCVCVQVGCFRSFLSVARICLCLSINSVGGGTLHARAGFEANLRGRSTRESKSIIVRKHVDVPCPRFPCKCTAGSYLFCCQGRGYSEFGGFCCTVGHCFLLWGCCRGDGIFCFCVLLFGRGHPVFAVWTGACFFCLEGLGRWRDFLPMGRWMGVHLVTGLPGLALESTTTQKTKKH